MWQGFVAAGVPENNKMQGATSLRSSRLKTLILTLHYPHRVSYYDDWSDAFCNSRDYACTVQNIRGLRQSALASQIDNYDAIILLHSCNSDTLDYLTPLAPVLANRKRAKLLSFNGNEFNSPHISMVDRIELLRAMRCDITATQMLQEAGEFLYVRSGAQVISVPHALNPDVFQPGPAHGGRRLDLGVKGYRYPPFLGDDDRNRLLSYFQENAENFGLAADITYDQRLTRENWLEFLCECRGTISTEAGSWYLDPDDTLIGRIAQYLAARRTGLVLKNESFLRRAVRPLPYSIKAILWKVLQHGPVKFEVFEDFNVPFEELDQKFFRTAPRAPVHSKAISSRHFDAIGTKTCQIMLRGRYNDILRADEHYIAIDPSFADAPEAIRRFKDAGERQLIVDRAHAYVMASHTYAHRAADVRKALEAV